MISIYVHFPFCKNKCIYCDFVSGWKYEPSIIKLYVDNLINEILIFQNNYKIEENVISLYFGGGTPSLLDTIFLDKIVNTIFKLFKIDFKNFEFTLEVNPEDVNVIKSKEWKNLGINRISLGFQSMNLDSLKLLGRNNTPQVNEISYNIIRDTGFNNINIDLILSIPGDNLENTIEKILIMKPEHISTYNLSIEEKTLLYILTKKSEFQPLSDKEYNKNFLFVNKILKKNNYEHYEISNYNLSGNYKSIHNLNYWNYGCYIGFGLGATGFLYEYVNNFKGFRWNNCKILKDYFNKISLNNLPYDNYETIDFYNGVKEFIMMGLRKIEGLNLKDFKKIFNIDFFEIVNLKKNNEIIKYLSISKNYFKIKNKYMRISNYIISNLWDLIDY